MGKSETIQQELDAYLEPGYLDLDGVLDDLEREVVLREGLFGAPRLEVRGVEAPKRKLALALSGGGAGGAYSAGALEILLARLKDRGIAIDLLVGTSSGAINGYGVFVEELDKENSQLSSDPEIKQPFHSYIASVWSYLDRDGKASRWVVGRRAWMIGMASKGVSSTARRWGIFGGIVLILLLLNPYLFVSLFTALGFIGPDDPNGAGFFSDHAVHFSALGLISLALLGGIVWMIARAFGRSLFLDTPLLRLLADTGPEGDLSQPRGWPRAQTIDRARVLSRELVSAWYEKAADLPEFIITATDITVGRECLFTLVRPATYRKLMRRGWMAVQFDTTADVSKGYRESPCSLFSLPENLLRTIVASSAVPGAFPTQRVGIYGPSSRRHVRHRFVDGGVLNNSPIHIAIDAGATHIISVELQPLGGPDPMEDDERSKGDYGLFQAALKTFTTVLDRATDEDIRRTVAWNRFLMRHPESLRPARTAADRDGAALRLGRRIVPIYRIAPKFRQIGTVEFDGHFEDGKRVVGLRDLIRRGLIDMQGKTIWRATMAHEPRDVEK